MTQGKAGLASVPVFAQCHVHDGSRGNEGSDIKFLQRYTVKSTGRKDGRGGGKGRKEGGDK